MNTFHQKLMDYIESHRLLERGDHVLVGCSGGIDSLVLLHFLKTHEQHYGIRLSAVHVNHMLRGEESLQDRIFTESLCREWSIRCFSRDIPIPAILKAEGGNKQQVCREQRYAYFAEILNTSGANKLATAHHADDQLETILLSGLRGTLETANFGMPVRRPFGVGELVRPLLAVTRDEVANYAAEEKINHREDSSNAETAYTRNRVRHTILPLLKKENPRASEHFAELAETIQEDRQFIEELARIKLEEIAVFDEESISLSAEKFAGEALALQKRMVLLLLNYLYNEQEVPINKQLAEQIREMMGSSSGTVFLHLPGHYQMVREYDTVLFGRRLSVEPKQRVISTISTEWSEIMNGFRYKAVPVSQINEEHAAYWYFDSAKRPSMVLRNRKPGDRIQLAGMEHPKKVARLMIDEKVPTLQRENWPVIAAAEGDVLLVPGLRHSCFFSRKKRPEDDWVLIEQYVKIAKSGL
ncbi:tRNA lysidine(34) synthetase TilS [Planococcus sp. 107-1]|uniref:tRNA lysidine(34) synthetase TilS n=1 Tax=Planococcus sp. 107-1 TaxID=2908840 RepID=UPI001F1769F5|nr:tRNA lysidine(34) synthetase TilS [Planococcus sp. 107-1]UJF26984.1 tRNA lysidine(34) synthetase TilS [Planococcus sp. 107-1]